LKKGLSVVVVGAGAIGLSLTGWIFPYTKNLHLLARGNSVSDIRNQGIRLFRVGQESTTASILVKVIDSLDQISPPDILIVTVKNYDLDQTAMALRRQLGKNEPIVVSLQNGLENQLVIPKYFSKAVFGVICYNAWREAVGKVSYVKPGYVVIGSTKGNMNSELQDVAATLNPGLECFISDRFQDAVHCKLVINLINGLMALVGFRKRSIESAKILVHITTRVLEEGVRVLQAAGFKEHYLGSMPSWKEIQTAVDNPESPKNPLYDFIINRVGPTSMTQDVFSGKTTTELDSLNGYMLSLAHRAGVSMPINQAIYEIAKERFHPDFKPIKEIDLWAMINDRIVNRSLTLQRTKKSRD
jgi:2-dehydropantoate 2-reductase